MTHPVRVLAVGDSYMPASVFTAALAGLGDTVSVTELQLDGTTAAPARTDSEQALREYVGDPAHLVAAVPNGLTVEYMGWMLRLFEGTAGLENSELLLPERPGLGLAFREDTIARFGVSP